MVRKLRTLVYIILVAMVGALIYYIVTYSPYDAVKVDLEEFCSDRDSSNSPWCDDGGVVENWKDL